MKKTALALAILAAMTTVAYAESSPSSSGDISVYGGWFDLADKYDSDYSGRGYAYGGAIRINAWLSPTTSVQLDANVDKTTQESDANYDQIVNNYAIHLSHRDDNVLFGGFASSGTSRGYSDFDGSRFATLGFETQLTGGPSQVYLQTGVTKSVSPSNYESAPYIRLEAKHFFGPNTMLAANMGYSDITYDRGGSTIQHKTWGVDLEHRFEGSVLSMFASYQGSHNDEVNEHEAWLTHTILLGLKLNFGSDTLQAASKTGPTLADYNPITGVERLRLGNWE